MRALVLNFALCLTCLCSAYSQGVDEAAPSQNDTPLYFLVDASGSMLGQNQTDAELLLSALSLPKDQLVSVTFFGSEATTPGMDLCSEDLEVPTPARRGMQFSSKLPKLGDKTAISNAIGSVLGKITEPAKFVVITDGGEECDDNFGRIRTFTPMQT